MELINSIQHGLPWLSDITFWHHLGFADWFWQPPLDWLHLAQQLETDVFKPVRDFFDNFIRSGQVWALLIGLILGYLFRSLTSYG